MNVFSDMQSTITKESLKGATITTNAMGTQTAIAQQIDSASN